MQLHVNGIFKLSNFTPLAIVDPRCHFLVNGHIQPRDIVPHRRELQRPHDLDRHALGRLDHACADAGRTVSKNTFS